MKLLRAKLRLLVLPIAVGGALAFAGSAFGHAEVSPPVVVTKHGQFFTLAVPTEKENATTTAVELTPPSGFSIDSFAPAPGWKRVAQTTGTGENTVIQKITWTGGKVPTEEDAVFQFLASADTAKTYSFKVRQTYSDGSVVDWAGPRVLRHAGPDGRSEVVARRRWERHPGDRRTCGGRARARRCIRRPRR